MPAARCSMCARNYPPELEGRACPECGEQLHLQQDEKPDPELMHLAKTPAPPALPEPKEIEIRIRRDEESGTLWIHQAVLEHLGYYKLDTFDKVEIEGVSYELQGFRPSTGEWWIELVEQGAAV